MAPSAGSRSGIGRGPAWTLAAAGGIALIWATAATWYILCRDDFVQTFLARQAEMRIAYEDRVGELRNRLEHEITAGLLERRAFGSRVDAIVTRQAEIEARQVWLSGLAERVGASGPAPQGAMSAGTGPRMQALPFAATPGPTPLEERAEAPVVAPSKPVPLPVEPFDLRLRGQDAEGSPATPPRDRLSAVQNSLRRLSETGVASTDALRRGARERAFAVRQVLAATRAPLPRAAAPERDVGGPFIPAPAAVDAAAFAPLAADAEDVVSDLERMTIAARALPLGRPIAGDLEQTSGFGYRIDPFTRSAAIHSGVDFRAAHGTTVRATAAGRVTTAEYTGGYGNMVEIEHENGVSTRYGHLSAIGVVPGQKVEAGQTVGRAGSTGRSTGTHLHYETRIDGEAVNPARFLEAGRLLATLR